MQPLVYQHQQTSGAIARQATLQCQHVMLTACRAQNRNSSCCLRGHDITAAGPEAAWLLALHVTIVTGKAVHSAGTCINKIRTAPCSEGRAQRGGCEPRWPLHTLLTRQACLYITGHAAAG